MTTTAPTTGRTSPHWRGYVRRGGVAFALCVIAGLLLGLLAAKVSTKRYTATASVLVTATGVDIPTNPTNGRTTTDINLDTEAQLVTSASVLDGATHLDSRLDRYTYEHLVSNVAVTVPANTTVLQIAYTDSTAKLSQAGANAIATAYLNDREARANDQLQRQIDASQLTITTLSDSLKQMFSDETQAAQGSAERSFLDARIQLTKSRIAAEQHLLVQLSGIPVTPGRIRSAATLPTGPSSPSLVLDLASGLAIGLLFGALAAWAMTRFRRTVRTADDLAYVVNAPCVAVLQTADPSAMGAVGTYRHLALVTASVVQEPARIVITSPLVMSVCSHVAAGVAASLTRSGTPTALLQVHGDEVDSPYPPAVAVSRVVDADDVVRPGDGSLPAALDRVRGENGVLVVDVPGAIVTANAQIMAADADAVLLVVPVGTRSAVVREAIAGLDSVGAPILGTVLVLGSAETSTAVTTQDGPTSRGSSQARGGANRHASAGEPVKRRDRAGATPRG